MQQKLSPDREIDNIEQCLLNYAYLGQPCPEDLRLSINDVLAVDQKKQSINYLVNLYEVVNIPQNGVFSKLAPVFTTRIAAKQFYKEIVQSQHLQYLFAIQDIFLVKNVCFLFMGSKTLKVIVSYIMENLTHMPIFIFSFRNSYKEFQEITKYNPTFSYRVNWAVKYEKRKMKKIQIQGDISLIKDEVAKVQQN